jgi:hypothetical protein
VEDKVDVDDSDLDAVVVPGSLKIAGGVLVLTGVLTAMVGLQVLVMFVTQGPIRLVIPLALSIGGGCVYFGTGVARARPGALVAGMVLAAVAGLLCTSWFGFVLYNGALAPVALAVLPLAILSLLLMGLGLPHARRVENARVRLRAEGLDAGL